MVKKRISVDSKIMVGKPVIAGTRITVEHILELLAAGETKKTIVKNYPFLKEDDIVACINYATRLVKERNANEKIVSPQ